MGLIAFCRPICQVHGKGILGLRARRFTDDTGAQIVQRQRLCQWLKGGSVDRVGKGQVTLFTLVSMTDTTR